eukprot:TRINITY_DN7902_c0_g1_i1.p1 TRINITY_DN7902_c0_g1~~TRINITY_DN7902_c0_g1_i1.p1  ORF type:complete len:378 (-),score=85.59 TRINITY_DN7902_c0_g1_i1:163-1296(-)
MASRGFDALVFQIGRGSWIPTLARLENDPNHTKKEPSWPLDRVYYRFKEELSADLQGAALVISHAGAATTMESLLARRDLIVVANDTLMDNHQFELAEEMSKQHYLWHATSPRQLYELVERSFAKVGTAATRAPKPLEPLTRWPDSPNSSNDVFDAYLRTRVANHHEDNRDKKQKKKIKTLVVLGSGGHTGEMFRLIRSIDREIFSPIVYCHASSDEMSRKKAVTFESSKNPNYVSNNSSTKKKKVKEHELDGGLPSKPEEFVFAIPRSRKVHQSYFTSIFTTLYALLASLVLLLRCRPDFILCNGPGTCVPLLFLAFLLNALRIKRVKTMYVESIARVKSLSLSGKLLYRLVDHFVVQWAYLSERYPKAQYLGIII